MFFGKNIKHLRALRGMTQADLAETLDVNSATVTGWETGKSFPHFQVLLELRNYFQVDLESLVYSDLQNESKEGALKHPSTSGDIPMILETLEKVSGRLEALEQWQRKMEKK